MDETESKPPSYVNAILEKLEESNRKFEESNRKFEETNRKLDLVIRQQSSVNSASTMNDEKLKRLFNALGISGPYGSDEALEALGKLAKDNRRDTEFFCNKPRYEQHIREKLELAENSVFSVTDAPKESLESAEGEKWSAMPDALIILKRAGGPGKSQYAVAGFELKKSLAGLLGLIPQAATEWAVIAAKSHVPYVQLLTDLNSGGLAFYLCQDKPLSVQFRVFLSMDTFWVFVREVCHSVEDPIEEELKKTGILYPIIDSVDLADECPAKRFRFSVDGTNFRSYPVMTEWLLERLEPTNDIAYLKDLEDYPELESDASSFNWKTGCDAMECHDAAIEDHVAFKE